MRSLESTRNPLESTTNPFGGILPDPDALAPDPDAFQAQLSASLELWKEQGFQVVWLEIPACKAGLVPVAVEAGFRFHHTGENYLMLTLQLKEGAFVPAYATHYIGAGGVVLTPERELLVVSERYHRTGTTGPRYKLPGGALREGEHLADGVIREVREETGVETGFEALVCLRHWHGYRYGKSDIYFVCRRHPLTREITRQEEEIAECRWMPVEEYLAAENVSAFNKEVVRAAMNSPGLELKEIEGYGDRQRYEIFMPPLPERR